MSTAEKKATSRNESSNGGWIVPWMWLGSFSNREAERPDAGVTVTILMSFVVGVSGGLLALVFIAWIGLIETYLLRALLANEPTPFWQFGWHWLIIPLPAAGLLVCSWMATRYAPEASGNGVPEVISAVSRLHGVIRPRVVAFKAILSGICLGTGGSVGAEGPIVQMGAAVASVLGKRLSLSERNVKILVAAGAAAGISATFGAPLAGVLFSCEVILGSFSVSALTPIVISAVMANVAFRIAGPYFAQLPFFVSERIVDGQAQPLFRVASTYSFDNHGALPLYLVLGVLAGLVAVSFTKFVYFTEDVFFKWFRSWYVRAIVGGLVVGLAGMHPQAHSIFGNGYDLVLGTLTSAGFSVTLLVVLLVLKFVGTSSTLAGGGSGGIFAPSLYLGAVLGSIVGQLSAWAFPVLQVEPGAFALVGMAAVVAGTTHAPVSAMLILFEMTSDYKIILPVMAASVLASLISRVIDPESIYLKKLSRRGEFTASAHHTTSLEDIYVRDLMIRSFPKVQESASLTEIVKTATMHPHLETLPVVDSEGQFLGIIGTEDLHRLLDSDVVPDLVRATDIVRRTPTSLSPEENLLDALRDFGQRDVEMLPVIDMDGKSRLIGLLPRAEVMRRYRHELLRHHPRHGT